MFLDTVGCDTTLRQQSKKIKKPNSTLTASKPKLSFAVDTAEPAETEPAKITLTQSRCITKYLKEMNKYWER